MPNSRELIDHKTAVQEARGEALTSLFDLEVSRLRAIVRKYIINCTLGPSTWFWDVRKRRVVTVVYLVGQHSTPEADSTECCWTCAALQHVLPVVASFGLSPEVSSCQRIIGACRRQRTRDSRATEVDEVWMPIVFVHRKGTPPNGESCELKCIATFRSLMEQIGVELSSEW